MDKETQLEDWAIRAGQVMQDIVDEAQLAAGEPDGVGECPDIREMLSELDALVVPRWQDGLVKDPRCPIEEDAFACLDEVGP